MKLIPKVETRGFINVDKPTGKTSSTIVNRIKWLTGLPSGHMGTLDPLASGVLPVGVGNATRLFEYFLNKTKEYVAEFTFGLDSDTLDSTGEVTSCGFVPTASEIQTVLSEFEGDVLQVPPKYSAKNVGGRRGYELARKGVAFELEAKRVHIDKVELLDSDDGAAGKFRFLIRCGGGTYIRSLARDIAQRLGTKAVMSALRRTKSGIFEAKNAVFIDDLTEKNVENYIILTENVLPFPKFTPENERIFCGLEVKTDEKDGEYRLYRGENFYGIAEIKEGRARAKIKLC